MNIEEYRAYCLSLPGTTEELPFDEDTLVFKVMGKMYALTGITDFAFINLKCDPEEAILLREQYDFVQPGYHMSKKHWNSVYIDGRVDDAQLENWTKDSYDLVVKGFPKKTREELANLD